ncbi:MAG TPA: LppP/LprE family lipoprotein [Methylomirabilota bacterium]|nr:LppP/LprE family lipoprotein [Methylomirabilota bacterium]
MAGAALLAVLVAAAGAETRERGRWLEEAPLASWNKRGGEVPKAPAVEAAPESRCGGDARPAASKEDKAVGSAGWSLVGAAQSFAGARLFLATAGYDAMCRPVEFQGFVFLGGRLAGLLSPAPMRSRTDGAVLAVRLLSETSLEAEFARYLSQDPLCCPSRTTVVRYRIEPGSGDEAPLLVAERAIPAAR